MAKTRDSGLNDLSMDLDSPPADKANVDKELDQYGVWVKVSPEAISEEAPAQPETEELADLNGGGAGLTDEEEELLGELETNMSSEGEPMAEVEGIEELSVDELPEEPEEEIGELTLPTAADDLSQLEVDEPAESIEELPELPEENEELLEEIEVPLSEDVPADEGMNELAYAAGEEKGTGKESSDVLQKIEEELTSIKQELLELKTELANLRAPKVRASEAGPEMNISVGPDVEVEPVTSDVKGFFDQEEDETIALTGDELDNIMNTADITEEAVETGAIDEGEGEPALSEIELLSEELEAEPEAKEQEEVELEMPSMEPLDEEIPEITLDEGLSAEGEVGEEISLEVLEGEAAPGGDEAILELPQEEEIADLEEITEEAMPAAEDISLEEEEVPDEEEISLDSLVEGEELTDSGSELVLELPEEGDQGEVILDELPGGQTISDEGLPEYVEEKPGGEAGEDLKEDVKTVLSYMDKLLESLPEEKIEEFAKSQYFEVYKKLFEELGIGT
jgi:hypothetical protein